MQKFWGLKGDQIKHLKEKIWTIEMSKLQQCWYYSKLDILWIFIKASRVLLKIDNTCLNRFHAKFSWPFYLAGITNWMSTGQIQTSNAFCLTHTMLKKWLRDFFKKNLFLQIFTKYPHAHSAQCQTRETLQMKRHTRPALMRPTAKIRTQGINIRESAVNVMVQ